MKIQNPHDKFFKETFGKVEVAKDFLNNYLPGSIMKIVDMSTLEPQKDSFINKELQEVFSDMLFRVDIDKREGYIYFLFEHKSYISKNISFQLIKYMLEIWESKMNKERIEELPVIIPLVIYHGKNKWNISTNLGQMINGYKELPEDVKKYIPDYEYLLYDISGYTDEEIKGGVINKIAMTTLRDIQTKDIEGVIESIYKMIEYLIELEDKQTGIEYFETLMKYVFNARVDLTKEAIIKVMDKIESTYPEGSDLVMTLAEKFREEGKKEGKEEGIEIGERKSLVKTTIKLLTKKFGALPDETKEKISKLDADTLEIIIVEIFEYTSLDEINKYL